MGTIRTRFIKGTLEDLRLETSKEIVERIDEKFKKVHLHKIFEEMVEGCYNEIKAQGGAGN